MARQLPKRIPGCHACQVGMTKASAARSDMADAKRKLVQFSHDPTMRDRYVQQAHEMRARANQEEIAYLAHQAAVHGTVDPPRQAGGAFAELAPGNPSVISSNREAAERLRAGETLEDLAAEYGITAARLRTNLNDAGWGIDGLPNHKAEAAARPSLRDLFQWPPWVDMALCAQTDPEAFFPEKGGSTRAAKAICARCPVRAECIEYALANQERFGIWGGLSERERRRLKAAS